MDQATINKIGYGLGGFAILLGVGLGAYVIGTRKPGVEPAIAEERQSGREPPRQAANVPATSVSAAPSARARHPVFAAKSLSEAIKIAQPSDSVNENDAGTLLLTGWAHAFMTLEAVRVTNDETTFGKVMKDRTKSAASSFAGAGASFRSTLSASERRRKSTLAC
jgi:hypothetical protein